MFKNIAPDKIEKNSIHLIAKEWMLITAGNINSFNNMTAAWGGLGYLWNKPVVFVYVRPTRYTYKFMENNDFFTLTFFEEKFRNILNLAGTKSGCEIDKMHGLGLTPVKSKNDSVYYEEAQMVMECRKLYFQDIDPDKFLDNGIISHYPKRDFHRIYTAEIVETLIKES